MKFDPVPTFVPWFTLTWKYDETDPNPGFFTGSHWFYSILIVAVGRRHADSAARWSTVGTASAMWFRSRSEAAIPGRVWPHRDRRSRTRCSFGHPLFDHCEESLSSMTHHRKLLSFHLLSPWLPRGDDREKSEWGGCCDIDLLRVNIINSNWFAR